MLLQLLILVVCHEILAVHQEKPFYDVENYEVIAHHFEKFIKHHQRRYNHHEKPKRFQVFLDNLRRINLLNEIHKLATFDIGKFTDMTDNERRSYLGLNAKVSDDYNGNCTLTKEPSTHDAPDALDYRQQGVVSPVKDQKKCGSCWAFSATGLVESRSWQKGNKVILSEQQMVDCDKQSAGCSGGLMSFGLSDIITQGGQESETDYPYEGEDNDCRFDKNKIAAKVISCSVYSISGEDALKELLFKEGPLSIAVAADNWFDYHDGILDKCDYDQLDHGVLLVGYGSEAGQDFWIIKNSWSTTFGENGFIRIKRGVKCDGISSNKSWATVSATVA